MRLYALVEAGDPKVRTVLWGEFSSTRPEKATVFAEQPPAQLTLLRWSFNTETVFDRKRS